MRGRMLRSLVALAVLLTLASVAGEAWARAGGGGSRGSRSYSSPARPAPSSPTTPTSPSRSFGSPASPAPAGARPSFMSRFGGMMGGFLLGGLLGGLLFGGLGGGLGSGIGLFDILLIGGGLFLLYKFMQSRRQAPQPAYAGGMPGESAGSTILPERPPANEDLDRGLSHVRQMDATFDAAALASDAAETFRAVQLALGAGDMSSVRSRLTPEMQASLDAQCASLRRAGHTNHVERIQIDRTEVTEAWQERGTDFVTVVLTGTLLDYTVDGGGAVVTGSRTAPDRFEEYWTFTRPVGPNAWRLTAIQAG